jgi:hypothetical protein
MLMGLLMRRASKGNIPLRPSGVDPGCFLSGIPALAVLQGLLLVSELDPRFIQPATLCWRAFT